MDFHFSVKAQKYALDILKLNDWGVRANGLMPENLQAYEIFGDEVVAPCSGEVISRESGLNDQIPPNRAPENLLGNHVILSCMGHSVLLAHLKQKSIIVKDGDRVEVGSFLGRVGNSGNTTEPHLHIHAVEGRVSSQKEISQKAQGVPMLFHGDFLIRNDRVEVSPVN